MKEYIIVGDTEKYNDCLICTCGDSLYHAEMILEKLLTEYDSSISKMIAGHTNIHIKEIDDGNRWWIDGCD